MEIKRKIGIAIIGTSGVGRQHAKALLEIEDAELVGVWGSNPERTKDFASQFGIKSYSSLNELLADKKVAIVDVVGMHNQHSPLGILAARSGKHVIMEKPLAVSVQSAKNLIDECRKNGVFLATVFQHRYDGSIKKLKEAINCGKLGRIFMANAVLARHRSQEYYDSGGGWRKKKDLSGGGVMINQAIHNIDSLVFLLGEAAYVYGEAETFNHNIEVEDVAVGIMHFKNNVRASISMATAGMANVPDSLEIHGTLGSARIEGETLKFYTAENSRLAKLKNRIINKIENRIPFVLSLQKKQRPGFHKENLAEIIKSIKNNQVPPVGFEEGLKSLEIVEALMESAKIRKPVELRPAAQNTFEGDYFQKYLLDAKNKKPKVLIINPLNQSKSNAKFSHIGEHRLRQPLGLAYVSSFLKKITSVQLIDAAILEWDSEKTIEYIKRLKPEILIISSGPLDRWQNPDLDISGVLNILNKAQTKSKILIGAHGSVTPDWVFKNSQADFVIRGEPEQTCFELVQSLLQSKCDFEKIDGLSWRKGEKIFHNQNRIFSSDLDEYPFPDYESLPMHLYRYTTSDLPGPFSLMLTSRGCPGQCVFCLKKMMPDKYRGRSAYNILKEMKYLADNFSVHSFYFQDWEFLINKERVRQFCGLLIKTPDFNVRWGCSARASSLDPEVIGLMKRAGCVLINFGFESGSQEILKLSQKGVSLEKVKEMVKICRDEGITLRPFCLVNLPGETKKTLKESARFIVDNDLNIPHINLPIPYPGTKLAETSKSDSWETALYYTGKVGTTLEPETARKLLRKYIWREKYGILYFINPKFWLRSYEVLKRKIL